MQEIRWPNGARCAVAFTVDVDAESLWLMGNPEAAKKPKLLSLGTYGPLRGVVRILDLFDRYAIKSTFFIPGYTIERYPEVTKEVFARGHEIAHHGYLHEPFGTMNDAEEKEVIARGIKLIEGITGSPPVGIRPHGDHAPHTMRNIRDFGFLYDSSWRGDDRPFRVVIDGKPSDLIEIPAHWELDDAPFFLFQYPLPAGQMHILGPESAYQTWVSEFDGYYHFGLCYVLMLHPQLIGKPGRVLMLERLIQHMRQFPDVWFARMQDIAQYWKETY